jgi:hypothetical protein
MFTKKLKGDKVWAQQGLDPPQMAVKKISFSAVAKTAEIDL